MSDFTDDFELEEGKEPGTLTATGEWYGDDDVEVNAHFRGGDRDKAIAVLESLYRHWRGWRVDLIEAVEEEHGEMDDFWIVSVSGYDGSEEGDPEGYFEIQFRAPDLFEDDIALAGGRIGHGFDEIGVPD